MQYFGFLYKSIGKGVVDENGHLLVLSLPLGMRHKRRMPLFLRALLCLGIQNSSGTCLQGTMARGWTETQWGMPLLKVAFCFC